MKNLYKSSLLCVLVILSFGILSCTKSINMENLEMVNGELQLVISPGETVNIKKGIETDVPVSIRDINSTEDNPTIINFGPEAWIIAGEVKNRLFIIDNCSNLVISGLKLDGKGMVGSGLYIHDVQHFRIEDFHIRNLINMGVYASTESDDDNSKINHHISFINGIVENVESTEESATGIIIRSARGREGSAIRDPYFHNILFDGLTIKNIKHAKDSDGIKIFPGNEPDGDRRNYVVDVVIRNCNFYRTWKRAVKLRGQNITLENLVIENDTADVSVRGGPMIDLQSVKNLQARNIKIKCSNHNAGISGHRYIEDVVFEDVVIECVNSDGSKYAGQGRGIGYIAVRVYKNVLFKNINITGPWKNAIYLNEEDGDVSNVVFENITTNGKIQLRNPTHEITFRNCTLNMDSLYIHPGVKLENVKYF